MRESVAKKTRFHRFAVAILAATILFSHVAEASPNRRAVRGNPRYAAIVLDAQSGRVLSESNADKSLYPASLTKMMTLFLAFEAIEGGKLHLDKYLTVSRRAVNQPPSKLGLKIGERITVKQAILALVTRSANDVAVAMAETIGGTESNFVRMMNERAKSLGMNRTTWRNPHGLPNPQQKSSARDMAILARAIMQYFPQHYHFFKTARFNYRGKTIETHNNLMKRYGGMDGLKTGYTVASGFNLAASAVRNNRRVIVVVFGGRTANSRDQHVATLMNDGLASLGRERQGTQYAQLPNNNIQPQPLQALTAAPRAAAAQPAAQQASYRAAKPTAPALNHGGIANVAYVTGPTNWGIQVGAFGSAALGLKALQSARSKLSPILTGQNQPQALVIPTRTHNGVVYRARILGLSAQSAARACAHLDECMAFTVK
jgi:D-alanyl-D-alanine carboxypeptidase